MATYNASLICTVLDEEQTIKEFIDSIINQSVLPKEIIIIDGGSKDKTVETIKNQESRIKGKKINFKLIEKRGNRSVGRNIGIKNAFFDIILLSDSGCVLDKDWVKEIVKPFSNKKADVVAGYYRGESANVFQKCLIPYVLVMPDKINENEFLPATRSMAMKKSVWKKAGCFNEKLSHNEDFAFANKLKEINARIVFQKNAIVKWFPRKNLAQAFKMFFRFALGDVQANLFRKKVIYIFLRYIFAAYLLVLVVILKSLFLNLFIVLAFLGYILWAVNKNYKYVRDSKAIFYLPLLQFTSDVAVIVGTYFGVIQKFSINKIFKIIVNNKIIFFAIIIYIGLMFYFIQWGIPNLNHPFNYAMDEWHFSQALHTFIKYGTGSISGAASIPLYHIISSIVFILPFYLLHLVNPLAIKNTLDNIPMQHILFIILRLHTLFYGVLSVILIYSIFKRFLKIIPNIFTLIYIFSPIFLSLTNYYKYDVTLIFWIIATTLFLIKYYINQKFSNFIYAGIALGLALSTKFTAAPLFVSYIFAYLIFSKKIVYKQLFMGLFISIFIFMFIGIPDLIFGKGNYYQLLYSTLIQSPQASLDFNLGSSPWFFLLFKEFPSIFGYFLTITFYISIIFFTLLLFKEFINKNIFKFRFELFIYLTSLLFLISILIFNIDGGGNRALVVLPFMVLLSGLFIKRIYNDKIILINNILIVVMIIGLCLQIVQSITWISVKFYQDPRQVSSDWILNNIPKNKMIGIENIPIYQMLPDFVLKDFYQKQHDSNFITRYDYKVITGLGNYPEYVIITNDFDNLNYVKNSLKKQIIKKLKNNNYKIVKTFSPNLRYYNLFAEKIYFMVANIMPMPVVISIYKKE